LGYSCTKLTLVVDDGYQVRYYLKDKNKDENEWVKVLPHERRAGEYELLTPRQRMEKAMADLKSITGYDGKGVWTEGPKTVVDYTDTQGQKHHQELNVYFVHADENPESPVVYEVLEDPASGEMVFTIRASNHKDIKGLNEKQAALVRQAWAYLVSADPQVMQKFWRVNKLGGTGLHKEIQSLSTNWFINSTVGLDLINPTYLTNIELVLTSLIQESYELYANQFGVSLTKDDYKYRNLPPDCQSLDGMVDASLRYKEWVKKYGNRLPVNLDPNYSLSYYQNFAGGIHPCQPQIPFEP